MPRHQAARKVSIVSQRKSAQFFNFDDSRKVQMLEAENKMLKEQIEELKQQLQKQIYENEWLWTQKTKREVEEEIGKDLDDWALKLDGF